MKLTKTLAVLAVTLIFGVAAQAESSVTLFGNIDAGLQYNSISAPNQDSASHLGMASGQSRTSMFGLRGVEDIGSGNSIVWNLTSLFDVSNGSSTDKNTLFNQQATLGIRNAAYGQLDFGRQSNMASKYFYNIDPFATKYGQAGMGASFGEADNARYSNMIMFQSQTYSGFSAGAGYSFNTGNPALYGDSGVVTDGNGGFSTTNNQRAITLGASYVNGPLTVVATYDQVMPQSNVPGVVDPSTPKAWILGGSYDFQVVKAALAYGQTRSGWIAGTQPLVNSGITTNWPSGGGVLYQNGFGANSYLVGVTAPVNANSRILSSYQLAQPTGDLTGFGANQSIYSVGYEYDFSKRTTAYGYASYANNYAMLDGVKSTLVGVGMRHSF